MWIGANKIYTPESYLKVELKKRTNKKSLKQTENQIQKLVKKEEKKRKRLQDLGIDYDFPGYVSKLTSSKFSIIYNP